MPSEIWKQVRDYPYSVSNLGRVRRDTDEAATWAGRILSPRLDKDGYSIITMHVNGKRLDKKIHSLVCEAFNGLPKEDQNQVRHLDGNKQNFDPRNLKWGTAKENSRDRGEHGNTPKGENHSVALLSQNEVDSLRKDLELELAQRKLKGFQRVTRGYFDNLSEYYGVNKASLFAIVHGRGYNENLS